MSEPVRVLIVDDSSVVRQALKNNLNTIPGIEVVGVAPDPFVARDMIMAKKPDVITLDIEMPRMDGMTFLRKLMKFYPVRTIIVSSLTQKGCDTALACLEAGAMGVVAKPAVAYSVGDMAAELGRMIKDAAHHPVPEKRPDLDASSGKRLVAPPSLASIETTHKVIAIGTSTGGTEALRTVLSVLPKQTPGIIMTQHMPEGFTASFAARLNELCEIEVREAKDGDSVLTGLALLAPGNKHLHLARDGARYIVRVTDGPRVCRHKPSVEVLFESTAEHAGRNAMGIIMTGMGNDGAQGLRTMRDAGAYTVAQDKDSCVVFGMPREAIEKGGAITVCPLTEIPNQIMNFAAGKLTAKAA
ncbi:MAG: chemotaxis response regulator protein-glutamate methylesterase [Phycisphaerales bacterium]|nr:chemotaxis response regulator protein-glutamate methylesterase [Phycisphaerales bacterium]MCB9836277.1 chemotaxis response regulator protein-glutamate methylesterase [Phycisphaera sp.]